MIMSNFKKSGIPFICTSIVGIAFAFFAVSNTSSHYVPMYLLEIWEYSEDIFVFVFPLMCTVPYCWCIYFEKKSGFLRYVSARIPIKNYIRCEYITGALLAWLSIVIISISGLLFTLFVFQPKGYQENVDLVYLFQTVQMENPLFYGVVLSMWRGCLAFLYYTMGFIAAYRFENVFVSLSFPFIYSIFENFVTDMLGHADLSIISSFDINRISLESTSVNSLAVGPVILMMFISGMILIFRHKEKSSV